MTDPTVPQITLVDLPTQVPKETQDLMKFIVKAHESAQLALADGWQPGSDIPAVALACYQEALAALQGAQNIPGEAKAHPGKVAIAVAWATDKIISG